MVNVLDSEGGARNGRGAVPRGIERTTSPRLASIDALRGLAVAAMLLVNDPGDWSHIYAPFEHAEWNGCTFADFVFPLFLFVVGVSITLAQREPLDASVQHAAARAILWRALRIVALGVALNLIAEWTIADRGFRLLGVLQRIGVCYAAVALCALYFRPKWQWLLVAILLVGYWALLATSGPLQPGDSIVDRVDTLVLGRFAYAYDAASGRAHDPEGLLSTLPAIATTLLGLRAGAWLRAGEAIRMVIAGVIAFAIGAVWSLALPLNKQLWTSSFVLWTGAVALLALVFAHVLIDRRGWPALGRTFGINAIVAYAGAWVVTCLLEISGGHAAIYHVVFAGPLTPSFGPFVPSLAYAIAFTTACWLALRGLARAGWRFTI
jgi:predicted acyltransferase